MKKIVAIFATATAMCASDAMAQKDQFYAELNYVLPTAKDSGLSVTPSVIGGRFGMKFTDRVAGEVFLGTSASSDSVTVGGSSVDMKITDVVGLYLKGSLPVADKLNLFGRIGYTRARIKASSSGTSIADSDSGFSYGVGAQYDFTDKVYGMVDYMSFYDRNGTTITGPTVGVGYKF